MGVASRRSSLARLLRVVLGIALLTLSGCATLPSTNEPVEAFRTAVWVQGHWVSLRLSRPASLAPGRPLVVFITGDGGWRGKDLDAFEHLQNWGYAVAGISAPEYLSSVDEEDGIPPQALADDVSTVAAAARTALRLPGRTPVLLVGVSRGADLAVVAAERPSLRSAVRGVLVVGLTAEEEFVRLPPGQRPGASADDDASESMARPYAALHRVPLPVSLIQSTNDEYVPAADAQRLFGPDSAARQFHAIESRDHSFSDARDDLYGAMRQSLAWVDGRGIALEAQ